MPESATWILPAALILLVYVIVRRQTTMPMSLIIISILFLIPLGGLAVNIRPSLLQVALYLIAAFTSLGLFFRIRRGW